MTYALTLLGGLVAGALMLPVAKIMFPSPTDADLARVEYRPPVLTARDVARMDTIQPAVNDYEGSVAQMVARGHGYARQAVKAIYRGSARVARHARSMVWERPSAFVRRHRKGGGYHETLHASGSYKERMGAAAYAPRHSQEYPNLITDLEAMLATEAYEGVPA